MNSWPEKLVVVGGGTAGWLAAMMLGDATRNAGIRCDISMIESSKIGTVGVGEGTTAVFRQMLKHFSIDEMDFLKETGATFKFGIRHRDWRRCGHSYDGPIDDPHLVIEGAEKIPLLDLYAVANGKSVTEAHLFQHLINRHSSPFAKRRTRQNQDKPPLPIGPYHHAYHFDQALAGEFLKKRASEISLIDDEVSDILRDSETGDIKSLQLASGQIISAEFFIDCTGFQKALISKMGSRWCSYSDALPVNRAMPFWLDLPDDEDIPPYTLAWAQKAGWLWKIPTQQRYGCGYVYSDAHTSPEQAKREIEGVLGHVIEPRSDIAIDAGRLEQAWIGNCVSIGLASSFLEPLEATSIHGSIVQLMLLISLFGRTGSVNIKEIRERYNTTVSRQVDDYRDFIRLHYVSERRDSPFWCDVAQSHPEAVQQRLKLWSEKVPGSEDFAPFPFALPHVEHQLYTPVLDGLGLLNPAAAKKQLSTDARLRTRARKARESLTAEYRRAASSAIGHREFLNNLK